MNRKVVFAALAIAALFLVLVYIVAFNRTEAEEMRIFCAGSLRIPLEEVAKVVQERYGINVAIEPSGSVEALRKVTDLGKSCDLLALADYRLIPKFMVPEHADWYVAFATNRIVLAYTDNSRYANEIESNPDKWYEILMRSDVRFGFSDPNKDPCGYRAVGVIALASIYYNNNKILDVLIAEKTNMEVERLEGKINIYVPASLSVESSDLFIRPKSVDLIAMLEAGSIEYAFEYKSVAVQHKLKYIELPCEIDLGDPKYDDFYIKVSVHILCGTEKENEISLKSIVYGFTIPQNAKRPDLAIKFIKVLLSDEGKTIFESLGQPFLEKPLGYGAVPDELKSIVEIVGE